MELQHLRMDNPMYLKGSGSDQKNQTESNSEAMNIERFDEK